MKRKATRDLDAPDGCATPGDLLVDYVDGELSPAEAARAERHLAECEACRREVAALERSLAMAQSIWAAGADGKLPVRPGQPREVRPGRVAAAVAGVAAVVILLAEGYLGTRQAENRKFAADTTESIDSHGVEPAPDESALDDLDIEAFIQRQEQSARLAASVQFLTTLPVDREDAERAERYLRDAYGVD